MGLSNPNTLSEGVPSQKKQWGCPTPRLPTPSCQLQWAIQPNFLFSGAIRTQTAVSSFWCHPCCSKQSPVLDLSYMSIPGLPTFFVYSYCTCQPPKFFVYTALLLDNLAFHHVGRPSSPSFSLNPSELHFPLYALQPGRWHPFTWPTLSWLCCWT